MMLLTLWVTNTHGAVAHDDNFKTGFVQIPKKENSIEKETYSKI